MESISRFYKSIQWINGYLANKEQPKYLLDPLSAIVKLSMLKYKDHNTKIRISRHKIAFCEPNPMQGISRWIMGDSRHNINSLYLPILFFCWLKNHPEIYSEQRDYVQKVFNRFNEMVLDGLGRLKQTYCGCQNDLVSNCLDLYVHLLSNQNSQFIEDKYAELTITTKNIYDEFLKCWTLEHIKVIDTLFKAIEKDIRIDYLVKNTLDMIDTHLLSINQSVDKLRVS